MTIATESRTSASASIPVSSNKMAGTGGNLSASPSGPNLLFAQEGTVHGDWRDDILRDGYVVLKGAIPRERADKYADEMMSFIENL